jgi:hypothetical protein
MAKAMRGRYGHVNAHFAQALLKFSHDSEVQKLEERIKEVRSVIEQMRATTPPGGSAANKGDSRRGSAPKPGAVKDQGAVVIEGDKRMEGEEVEGGGSGAAAAARAAPKARGGKGKGGATKKKEAEEGGGKEGDVEDVEMEEADAEEEECLDEIKERAAAAFQSIATQGRDYEVEIAALQMLPNGLLPFVSRYNSLLAGKLVMPDSNHTEYTTQQAAALRVQLQLSPGR